IPPYLCLSVACPLVFLYPSLVLLFCFLLLLLLPPGSTLFPYTTLFRSLDVALDELLGVLFEDVVDLVEKLVDVFLDLLALLGERSEEHTSELQSHLNLVCRLLLEKKKQQ